MHLFDPIINNIEFIISQGGYWVIFATSYLESLPLLGSAIPGHTIIIIAGFLSKVGIFNIWFAMTLASLGAILGDFTSYFLGKKYGYGFLKKVGKHFWIRQEHLDKAIDVVNNHTGKAIIMGRFNPIARTLIPFVIGASGVHIKRFWIYNLVGGTAWAVLSMSLGYAFGASYDVLAEYLGKFILLATVIVILTLWGYKFINERWNIFVRYDIFTLSVNIISIYILFKSIQDALTTRSFMAELDVSVNAFMGAHTSELGIQFMKFVSVVGGPLSLSILVVIASLIYINMNKLRKGILVVASFTAVVFWVGFIKDAVVRLRPENALLVYSDYSFPSLHAALAASACVLIIYLWASRIKKVELRELAISLTVVISFLVAYSRIYLSVHWFSDVVAGYAMGVFWTTLMILLLKYVSVLIVGKITELHEPIILK